MAPLEGATSYVKAWPCGGRGCWFSSNVSGLELGTRTVPFDEGVVGKNLEETVASRDCIGTVHDVCKGSCPINEVE